MLADLQAKEQQIRLDEKFRQRESALEYEKELASIKIERNAVDTRLKLNEEEEKELFSSSDSSIAEEETKHKVKFIENSSSDFRKPNLVYNSNQYSSQHGSVPMRESVQTNLYPPYTPPDPYMYSRSTSPHRSQGYNNPTFSTPHRTQGYVPPTVAAKKM